MRKILAILLAFALSAAAAWAVGGADIKASVLRYEPAPAEQGNAFDVWVQLSNRGTKADRVAVKFMPEYPFSLPEGQDAEISVGSVAATEDKVVKFTVFIDPNAPNGDRDITFHYKYSTIDEWAVLEAPITLQTQNAVLVIDEYKVSPAPVVPGQVVEVTLKLRNAGKIGVKNLDAGIDLADGTFTTVGSGTKKRIDRIDAGETAEVAFMLVSDTSTMVKVYSIPVSLDYQDERNKQYADTARFSLVVSAEPELSLTVDSTDFSKKTRPGTVSLKVVNKGIADLKYVTVRLVQTPEYEVLSPSNEEYIGNLDSDDFETVDFVVKPKAAVPRLKVQLDFKDPYNIDFHQEYDLPLRIITARDLGRGGLPLGKIVFVLIVIAAAVYWWRRKRKKR